MILLSALTSNRSFTAVGIAFLTLYITAYFCGIETTMLAKS